MFLALRRGSLTGETCRLFINMNNSTFTIAFLTEIFEIFQKTLEQKIATSYLHCPYSVNNTYHFPYCAPKYQVQDSF